jgi:hypothetical protein
LLIVSSDNGAAGRVYPPLRACKTSIYEGGHREPLVVRWPGHVKPASVCDDTVCLNDLMATCAEVVGAKLPDRAAEDSVSILPDLLGTAKRTCPRGHRTPVVARRPGHSPRAVEAGLPRQRPEGTLQPQG